MLWQLAVAYAVVDEAAKVPDYDAVSADGKPASVTAPGSPTSAPSPHTSSHTPLASADDRSNPTSPHRRGFGTSGNTYQNLASPTDVGRPLGAIPGSKSYESGNLAGSEPGSPQSPLLALRQGPPPPPPSMSDAAPSVGAGKLASSLRGGLGGGRWAKLREAVEDGHQGMSAHVGINSVRYAEVLLSYMGVAQL